MKRSTLMLAALVTLSACGGRSLGADWQERVEKACEAACEVASCDPNNGLFYGDAEACTANCIESERLEIENDCGEAEIDTLDCFASLSCDEMIARSEAVLAGEENYACKEVETAEAEACG